ncbi:MAG: C1 family peptidase [Marinilabiliales bacterium]
MVNKSLLLLSLLFSYAFLFSQNDKAVFKQRDFSKSFLYNTVIPEIRKNENKETNNNLSLSLDFKENYPVNPDDYTVFWHTEPVSQGYTGTCWCFSATSFMESEVKRINNIEVNLSEMWTVYWEYVERALDFVKTRGETYFEQGSEANAIPKIWSKYGIVPFEAYHGLKEGDKYHNHKDMVEEMKEYLKKVKENNAWNEEEVASTIKSILNYYMGEPPEKFNYKGQQYTPSEFLNNYLKLKMQDYFSFMSTAEFPYNEMHELVEADNWWHASNYWNLSLEDYMTLIKETLKQGYTISICGDISEPGFSSYYEVAIVPDFDIPSKYINESSRVFRMKNGSTTDDHCVHAVGYRIINGEWWFLMKDSGGSGFDGDHHGYCFMHEDYIKLKMMNILIHKSAAKDILDKIIK